MPLPFQILASQSVVGKHLLHRLVLLLQAAVPYEL